MQLNHHRNSLISNKLKNFLPIAYTEFWDRTSFYGLQSLVVIILTNTFYKSDHDAYDTYGASSSLSFGLGVIGGVIANTLFCTWLSPGDLVLLCGTVQLIYLIHCGHSSFKFLWRNISYSLILLLPDFVAHSQKI